MGYSRYRAARASDIAEFNPNEGNDAPEYATYIPGRSPEFKTHSNRGKAITAVNYMTRDCAIYKWSGVAWERMFMAYAIQLAPPCDCGRENYSGPLRKTGKIKPEPGWHIEYKLCHLCRSDERKRLKELNCDEGGEHEYRGGICQKCQYLQPGYWKDGKRVGV